MKVQGLGLLSQTEFPGSAIGGITGSIRYPAESRSHRPLGGGEFAIAVVWQSPVLGNMAQQIEMASFQDLRPIERFSRPKYKRNPSKAVFLGRFRLLNQSYGSRASVFFPRS
jgi:hypothetical protein